MANTRFWSNQSICKIWSCYVQWFRRRCIYKKVHYFTFDFDLRSRTNVKWCPVSSTSYELCTCKVWSCYVQQFRRKCIYKKYLIWPWPSQGHTKHCPLHHVPYVPAKVEIATTNCKGDAFTRKYIIWPWPGVKCVKVTQNVAQYSRHRVTYASAKFDVVTSHG